MVSDGWDIRSWDFRVGLVMSSQSRGGLRWLWPHLLLVLSNVEAVVEETSLACWMDWTD